jgi:hypothetical protein
MLIKNIVQIIVIIFIVTIPFSLIILIITDVNEFKKKLQNIHKKK